MKLPWYIRKRDRIERMDATIVVQANHAWCKECNHTTSPLAGSCLGCGKTFGRVTTPLQFNTPSVKRYRPDLEWEDF